MVCSVEDVTQKSKYICEQLAKEVKVSNHNVLIIFFCLER